MCSSNTSPHIISVKLSSSLAQFFAVWCVANSQDIAKKKKCSKNADFFFLLHPLRILLVNIFSFLFWCVFFLVSSVFQYFFWCGARVAQYVFFLLASVVRVRIFLLLLDKYIFLVEFKLFFFYFVVFTITIYICVSVFTSITLNLFDFSLIDAENGYYALYVSLTLDKVSKLECTET